MYGILTAPQPFHHFQSTFLSLRLIQHTIPNVGMVGKGKSLFLLAEHPDDMERLSHIAGGNQCLYVAHRINLHVQIVAVKQKR